MRSLGTPPFAAPRPLPLAAVLAGLVLAACGPAPAPPEAAGTSQRGDTTVVRSVGDGAWGPAQDAVEVLRLGDGTGQAFGYIQSIAALPGGGVVVYDARAAAGSIGQILSPEGKVVATFGRKGAGPGEIGSINSDGIVAWPDGSFAVRDWGNRRVAFFAPDGTPRGSYPTLHGVGPLPQVLRGPDSSLYLRIELRPFDRTPHTDAAEDERFGFAVVRADGTVTDTLPSPASWLAGSGDWFGPKTRWLPLPDGRIAVGGTDHLAVLLRPAHDAGPLLLIEHEAARVPFLKEEADELVALKRWFNKEARSPSQLEQPAVLPATKPAWKRIAADLDGRLWLERHVTAVKVPADAPDPEPLRHEDGGVVAPEPSITYAEPPTFAAFRLDGTFLGEVRFPPKTRGITFAGDHAWGIVTGADDVPVLVRYRLPGGK